MSDESKSEIRSAFDMQAYVVESSIKKRLLMVNDYALRAEDAWIAAYQTTVRDQSRFYQESEEYVGSMVAGEPPSLRNSEKAVAGKEEEGKKVPRFVELFQKWQSVAGVVALIKKETPGARELIDFSEKVVEKNWTEFLGSLDVQMEIPSVQEALGYLKEKAAKGQIWVLDSVAEEDEEARRKLLESSHQIGSVMCICSTASSEGDPLTYLIINKPLVERDMNPYEFLEGIIHERAHDFEIEEPIKRGYESSQQVFSEFFASMEQRRFYQQLPKEVKEKLPFVMRSLNEVPEDKRGVYSARVENLNAPLTLKLDEAAYSLMQAYAHAVNTMLRQGRRIIESDVLRNNGDSELLETLKSISSQFRSNPELVGGKLEWKRQD